MNESYTATNVPPSEGYQHAPLLEQLKADFRDSRKAQEGMDREMKLNLAFISGNQWVRWNPTKQSVDSIQKSNLDATKRPRRRPVHNLILPNWQTIVSTVTSYLPKCIALPGSEDKEARVAARVSTALCEYQRVRANVEAQCRNLAGMAYALGTAVIFGEYDPYANRPILIDEPMQGMMGQPMMDEMSGQPMMRQREVQSGEMEVKILPPWQCYPDPNAPSPEETEWIDIIDYLPQLTAEKKYQAKAKDLPVTRDSRLENFNQLYNQSPLATVSREPRADLPHTIVHHRFDLPCASYPEGRWIIWTESAILYKGSLPYGMNQFPLAVMTVSRPPCQWYGIGVISPARQPQATYNFNLGRMAEFMDSHAAAVLIYYEGSMRPDQEKTFNGASGSKVKINSPGLKPEYLHPPAFPHMNEMMIAKGDIDAVMGVTAAAKGLSPVSERLSAPAFQSLTQQYQQGQTESLKELIACLQHIQTVGLYIAAAKYDDTRMFYVLGKERSQSWFQIGGQPRESVAEGNHISFDGFRKMVEGGVTVVVEADPGVPMNRSQRRAEVFQLFQMLGSTPPQLWPVLFRLLGYGMTEDIYATLGMGGFAQLMGQSSPESMIQEASQQASQPSGGGGQGDVPPALMNMLNTISQGMQGQEQGQAGMMTPQ